MKKKSLAKTMREYAEWRFPGYSGGPVQCDRCGRLIKTLKYENISHRVSRSRDKKLAHSYNNLEILCGPTDFYGKKDDSCHTRHEQHKDERGDL